MDRRKINGVFFDLGWTLEKPGGDDWFLTERFFQSVSRDRFYAIEPEVRADAMNRAYRPLCTDHHMTDCEEENRRIRGYYADLCRFLNLGLTENEIDEIAFDHTYNFANYRVFDSTEPVLKTLKEHGYRIGVISDTWPSTVPQQKEAGLYDYYDFLVLSFELGVMKPHPDMYKTAIRLMGLPPEETVYIDDLTMSLDAAAAYGIHGIRSIAQTHDPSRSSYPCIDQPGDLPALLKEMNGGSL